MKGIIVTLTACLVLTGCTTTAIHPPTTPQVHLEQQEPSSSDQTIRETYVVKMIVQRGKDIIVFEDQSPSMGLLVNAEDFYMFAYRRDGEEVGVKTEKEIPFVKESQEEGTSQNEFTYVRLVQTPYIPGEGENAPARKDVVIFYDSKYPDDAFVGEQNPQKLDEWMVYQVKGYGSWLQKEIDLYLALYRGY